MKIEPYAGALGACLTDVNLANPTAGDHADIRAALLEYEVLFFVDQRWTPAEHAEFANYFGKAQLHQAYPHVDGFPQLTILENDEAHPSLIEQWHADMTFRARPPLGSILHCVVAPARGGDTEFASMSAAFAGLSDAWQKFVSGLVAVHDFRHGFRESLAEPGGEERLALMVRDNPPVVHPVVRTHPESGRRSLFVNPLFTRHIEGMKPRESERTLAFLYEHMVQSEFCCRFRWQKGSVAFWDNRITQHKPVNDYWPQHRCMQRITVDDVDVPQA